MKRLHQGRVSWWLINWESDLGCTKTQKFKRHIVGFSLLWFLGFCGGGEVFFPFFETKNGRKVIVIIPWITLPERLQDQVKRDQEDTTSSLPEKRQLEFVIRLKEKDAKFSKLFSVFYLSVKQIAVEEVCGFDDEEYEVCCCFWSVY